MGDVLLFLRLPFETTSRWSATRWTATRRTAARWTSRTPRCSSLPASHNGCAVSQAGVKRGSLVGHCKGPVGVGKVVEEGSTCDCEPDCAKACVRHCVAHLGINLKLNKLP